MAHIGGESRYQATLFPEVADDLVPADHAVRVIDAFVDSLDLGQLGFSRVEAEATGRPPYAPDHLLKLYVYGLQNQVRSSRRLQREAERNLEVLWLIDRVKPSYKTIADFRRDHVEAIVGVCRAFTQFCQRQDLFGSEFVAIDGTKIAAVASRKKVVTPKKLAEQIAALDRKIVRHLTAMDEADAQDEIEPAERVDVKAALAVLKDRRADIQRQAEAMAKEGLSQRVTGEESARLMRTPNHGPQVAYNAQIVVDAKHDLIAAFDLTSEGNDQTLLYPMAQQAKEALGVNSLTVLADTGYSNGEHGELCHAAQITAIVPRPATVNPRGEAYFSRDKFGYDAENDSYRCPAGQTLTLHRVSQTEQKKEYWNARACRGCPLKAQCTKTGKRSIVRSFYEDAREAMHRQAKSDPKWMKLRASLVEHPIGTMKWMMGYPRFLLRGSLKAKAELAFAVLGYNLKRAISIMGVHSILAAFHATPA
ncbi:MAG TPA: IS1182 family transposase [Rhizomicrobium sp.]|jgi:transposase|nr:IS1182 family transposase [Rhizomicrobium sp.]